MQHPKQNYNNKLAALSNTGQNATARMLKEQLVDATVDTLRGQNKTMREFNDVWDRYEYYYYLHKRRVLFEWWKYLSGAMFKGMGDGVLHWAWFRCPFSSNSAGALGVGLGVE